MIGKWAWLVDSAVKIVPRSAETRLRSRLRTTIWVFGVEDFDKMFDMAATSTGRLRQAFERLSELESTPSSLEAATDQGLVIPREKTDRSGQSNRSPKVSVTLHEGDPADRATRRMSTSERQPCNL